MKTKITTIASTVALGLFILPSVTFASWWNPLTWFQKSVSIPVMTSLTYVLPEKGISELSSDSFIILNGYKVPVSVSLNNTEKVSSEAYKNDLEKNLLMWKTAFQKISNMDNAYFNAHIHVDNAEVSINDTKKVFLC